jgi:hypothetical protein
MHVASWPELARLLDEFSCEFIGHFGFRREVLKALKRARHVADTSPPVSQQWRHGDGPIHWSIKHEVARSAHPQPPQHPWTRIHALWAMMSPPSPKLDWKRFRRQGCTSVRSNGSAVWAWLACKKAGRGLTWRCAGLLHRLLEIDIKGENMNSTRRTSVLLALFGSAVAFAGSAVPPPSWGEQLPSANTTTSNPVAPLFIGKLRVVLERTTLADVRSAIGRGEVARQGDAGKSVSWLCYTLSSMQPAQRLWLTSSELAGGSIINGFSAVEIANAEAQPQCPELPDRFRTVRFGKGLWLGSAPDMERHTSGAAKSVGNVWYQVYTSKKGEFDVSGTVAIEVTNSRVTALHAAHTTTN